MIGNYLNFAFRSLQRDKFHAVLNIAGLTISLAVTFLIVLYVKYEFSYENFFTEPDRVYRIETSFGATGQTTSIVLPTTPFPVGDALRSVFPDQLIATYLGGSEHVISVDGRLTKETVAVADQHLFGVLDFPFAFGNRTDLFTDSGNIVLTESKAMTLFSQANAVGEQILIDGQPFHVAAVLRDIPENSFTQEISILGSVNSPLFAPSEHTRMSWTNTSGYLLARLSEGVDIQSIESQLDALVERHMPASQKEVGKLSLPVRRLDRIHLEAGDTDLVSNHNLVAAYMLGGMALLLVLIASFNYINMTTARGLLHTKEVGVRKILGARKTQLSAQCMTETFLTTVLAFFLAFALAAVLLPMFSELVNRPMTISDLVSPAYLLIVGGLILIVGLISGIYPALFLASAQPKELFDHQKSSTGRRGWLRSVIVGAQFSMTLCLIVAASITFVQANHLRTLNLGFRTQGVLVIPDLPSGDDAELREAYNQDLVDSPFIDVVSSSNSVPATDYEGYTRLSRADRDSAQNQTTLSVMVDDQFFSLFGITPIAGRTFSAELGDTMLKAGADNFTYRGPIVISESAVPYFGFNSPEEATGQLLTFPMTGMIHEYQIVGVVPDIQFRLARAPIRPTAFYYRSTMNNDSLQVTSALVAPGGLEGALAHAEQTWSTRFPDKPFEYEFFEDRVEAAYADGQRQSNLFVFLTGLAILVTCLGLFGLVSFVAARRTREIAIRKVLGAKAGDVTRMLVWEFAKPILVASLIAWPIAWVLMRRWLDGFDYRIDLSPWFFIGATLLALAVAFLTVIGRTWKAAQTHPAQALKYE